MSDTVCTAWQGGCKEARDAGYLDAKREAESERCINCRFWNASGAGHGVQPCTVSGSFKAPAGLLTEDDFGCVHFSARKVAS